MQPDLSNTAETQAAKRKLLEQIIDAVQNDKEINKTKEKLGMSTSKRESSQAGAPPSSGGNMSLPGVTEAKRSQSKQELIRMRKASAMAPDINATREFMRSGAEQRNTNEILGSEEHQLIEGQKSQKYVINVAD